MNENVSSFRMIDVGNKPSTYRMAIAKGEIIVRAEAFELIRNKALPKGDVLILAEIAGIQGAKGACQLIPLCHPMGLDQVRIITELDAQNTSVHVTCIASVHAKTGVEMEALAGVNAALLTVWDLTKMVEPNLLIQNVRLLAKKGGKSGVWIHPEGLPQSLQNIFMPPAPNVLHGRRAVVLTASDRAARSEYADLSGPALADLLQSYGASVLEQRVCEDDFSQLQKSVLDLIKNHAPDVLITTGGTGVSQRDVTPEALSPLFERTLDGIGELLRQDGANYTPLSWSSRCLGGVIGQTLVIALPGNPKAVTEGLNALLPNLLPHLLRIIHGEKS